MTVMVTPLMGVSDFPVLGLVRAGDMTTTTPAALIVADLSQVGSPMGLGCSKLGHTNAKSRPNSLS